MKVLIAIIGECGAGKETVTGFLEDGGEAWGFGQHRFSDLIYETLKRWTVPAGREEAQDLAEFMEKRFGQGILARAVKARITNDTRYVVSLDGVRRLAEVRLVQSVPNQILYVTASQENRFRWLKDRKQKAGEGEMTWEDFLRQEGKPSEAQITELGSTFADWKIVNEGSKDELRRKVNEFFFERVQPLLK